MEKHLGHSPEGEKNFTVPESTIEINSNEAVEFNLADYPEVAAYVEKHGEVSGESKEDISGMEGQKADMVEIISELAN